MRVNIFNKAHYEVRVGDYVFKPFKEIIINTHTNDSLFREMRCRKELRIGKTNNADYKKRNKLKIGKKINFCYDIISQHAGKAYEHAIEALANPVLKHIDANISAGYVNRPLININCRFFSSMRINQQGKCPVGPRDVFFSHGIADKNYWIGKHIQDFNYAFVPGPAWEERMRKTGYKGEIFVCGYTKLDPLLNGEYKKKERAKPYVVWAPTHGYNTKNRGRSSYPQCLELVNQISPEYDTGLAMHPTTRLHSRKKHVPTMQELVDADVIIADAGSTLYEAWILGKPVIFPDWLCKKDTMSHFSKDKDNFEYRIYSEGIGYHAKNMEHMNKLIDEALNYGMKDQEKEFINTIYPAELRGKAGKVAAEQLVNLIKVLKIK